MKEAKNNPDFQCILFTVSYTLGDTLHNIFAIYPPMCPNLYIKNILQSNLPLVTTQNAKTEWSLT